MSNKHYDAATKQVYDALSESWLQWARPMLGVPADAAFEAVDSDLSSVTSQADKVFRFTDPAFGMVNLEFQSWADLSLPDRLFFYSALTTFRHSLPVHSIALLLRPEANASTLTGTLRRTWADGTAYLDFRYTVVRLWEQPLLDWLEGPIGLAPLAGLTNEARPVLQQVVDRVNERLETELPPDVATNMRSATALLLGMRYNDAFVQSLFHGITGMEESSTYQAILQKGEARGEARGFAIGRVAALRDFVQTLGEASFGPMPASTASALAAMDADGLKTVAARLRTATTWGELLAAG